jgi:predicted DNA-binding transcriptional regulator YafY
MVRIEEMLRRGNYPNCRTMAEALEVSEKTVARDVETMRDQMGVPIEYEASRHGYYLGEGAGRVPAVRLTEGELLALFLAGRVLGPLKGTSFGRQVEMAIHKIALYSEDSFDVEWEDLRQAVSVKEDPRVIMDAEVFATLEEAVRESRVVGFKYRKPGAGRWLERRVRPYHLRAVGGGWYLFGYDERRKAERTFALARMREVEATGERFERPESFSAEGWLQGSFGVFGDRNDKEKRVKLRFDPFAAQFVRERNWHGSQVIEEETDGGLVLTLRLGSIAEVERWVLSWGEHVEVLAPAALRRRIGRVAEMMLERAK